jgi:AraC-like DNA-binding protein
MPRPPHQVTFLPVRGIAGVEVMKRSYVGPPMPAYIAHGFVLSQIIVGDGDVRVAGQVQRLESGMVALAEPGELVAVVNRRIVSSRLWSLAIESSAFMRPAESAKPASLGEQARSGIVGDRSVKASLKRLFESVVAGEEELEQQSRYTALLAAMLRYEPRESVLAARSIVRRARSILHDRWAESVRLDELCGEVGADRFYLIRAFSRELGVTPHAYQVLLRVARARALLRAGRSLRDTCADAGFADQSHLSRHFRRVVGVTPGRYARLVRDVA